MQTAAANLDGNAVPAKHRTVFTFVLWTLQILLAALFLYAGVKKFLMPIEQMTKGTSLPGSFFYFIGVCEILGAIGLIVPAWSRILPSLTPIAAGALTIIMAGAVVISLRMGVAMAAFPLIVGLLCAFVAYGRIAVRTASRS